MASSKLTFTPSLFFQYATCPHWLWYEKFGDQSLKGETPALMEKLLEQGVLHEERYVAGLKLVEVKEKTPQAALAKTLELMAAGEELIYQGELEFEQDGVVYRGRPDLLEKKLGKASKFGDYFYAPCDIKSSKEIKKEQWMQLTLYATILEAVQGVFPEEVSIINRAKERKEFVITDVHRVKTQTRIEAILTILNGTKPSLRLTADCKTSPWYKQCLHEAEVANDIALLYKLDSRSHADLRACGINTVPEAAAMNIESLPEIKHASLAALGRAKLQAQSLMTGELRWLSRPELPETSVNIYFDIEGDPLLDVQYLWGFRVVGDGLGKYAQVGEVRPQADGTYFVYFLAEQPEQEREMWGRLLQWLELLPAEGYTVWHYNKYERVQCDKLAELYGDSQALRRFMSVFVDLEITVKDSVVFPLYSYSIKDIAKSKFLNFTWRHAKAGGAQSIFWYEEWLEKRDRSILNDIVNYNEDDVRATQALRDWLFENRDNQTLFALDDQPQTAILSPI